MIASFRFKGLEVVTGVPAPSLMPSLSLDNAKFMGAVISPLNGIFLCFSRLFRAVGLMLPPLLFSCPELNPEEEVG